VKEGQSSEMLGFRIPKSLKERIDKETGDDKDFRNTSEFVIYAIRFYLEYLKNQRIEEAKSKYVSTKDDGV